MHRIAALPIFALWLFTWCCFFGCSRQVAVTHTDTESDTVETHVVRIGQVSGQVPDIGQSLSIPELDINVVRLSDSVLLVRTPVRTDTRTFVRTVATRQIIKNAFNADSYNQQDTKSRNSLRLNKKSRNILRLNNKKAIQDSPESGNRLKKSQHRATGSGNRSKQLDKQTTNFPWWWWLLVLILGIGYWVLRRYVRTF